MTKRISTILFFIAAAVCAAPNPEGVPKDATETAPGVYRSVDKDGKTWIYRNTPFGVSKRAADDAQASAAAASASERTRMTPFGETKTREVVEASRESAPAATVPAPRETKVTEDGDTIRFERPSPFGPYKWSRKKDELSADEKRIWESQRRQSGTGNTQR